jgi:predicted metalloendopeptidase
LRGLIEATLKNPGKAGSEAHKIADLYTSFMDEKARNAAGFKPLHADLARVAASRTRRTAGPVRLPATAWHPTPLSAYVAPDAQDPEHYTVNVSQSGLGLPDRDYYLKADDAKLQPCAPNICSMSQPCWP